MQVTQVAVAPLHGLGCELPTTSHHCAAGPIAVVPQFYQENLPQQGLFAPETQAGVSSNSSISAAVWYDFAQTVDTGPLRTDPGSPGSVPGWPGMQPRANMANNSANYTLGYLTVFENIIDLW